MLYYNAAAVIDNERRNSFQLEHDIFLINGRFRNDKETLTAALNGKTPYFIPVACERQLIKICKKSKIVYIMIIIILIYQKLNSNLFLMTIKTRKGFLRKKIDAALFFRTGLHTFPSLI